MARTIALACVPSHRSTISNKLDGSLSSAQRQSSAAGRAAKAESLAEAECAACQLQRLVQLGTPSLCRSLVTGAPG